jgi:hypothetical protein
VFSRSSTIRVWSFSSADDNVEEFLRVLPRRSGWAEENDITESGEK